VLMKTNENHFWKAIDEISFCELFWNVKYSFFLKLLNKQWISKIWTMNTTNLINVYLTKKNEMSSTRVNFIFIVFVWRMRQCLFRASWDFSHIAHFAVMLNIWQRFFWCSNFSHRSHFANEKHWFSMWSYRQQL
jgi:hypothetical protein